MSAWYVKLLFILHELLFILTIILTGGIRLTCMKIESRQVKPYWQRSWEMEISH